MEEANLSGILSSDLAAIFESMTFIGGDGQGNPQEKLWVRI